MEDGGKARYLTGAPFSVGVTLGFAGYETLKQVFLPGLTTWQSHAMSTAVVALLATVVGILVRGLLHARGAARDVTARQEVEEAVRASAEGFGAIFDQAAVGIAIQTLDGRYVRVNERLCALLGYTEDELLGRAWRDITADDDPNPDHDSLARLLAAPMGSYAADKRYIRKDGGTMWGHLTLSVQRDAHGAPRSFLAVVEDCSARVAAEADVRAAAERYRRMFEMNRAIKLVVEAATGRILDANGAACDFYGYDHAAITARRIWDINALPESEVRAAMERAEREERLSFVVPHRLASGEIRDVEVYSGPVYTNGQTVLYSIIHDVTARTRAEVALRRQATHDSLTGLPNRALLHDRMDEALRASALEGAPWLSSSSTSTASRTSTTPSGTNTAISCYGRSRAASTPRCARRTP